MMREWALDLDMDGIRLMSRDAGQWQSVSTISLEDGGFRATLSALLSEHEVTGDIMVFLPESQVLYRSIDITSSEHASSDIEAVLEAETPYTANELEFDWDLEGPEQARVAAVALETLDEARSFVESFGLTILGFSALATPEEFPRRPDFGGEPGLSLTDFETIEDDVADTTAQAADGPDVPDDQVAPTDADATEDDEPSQAMTFATSRTLSGKAEPPLKLDAAAPVIAVSEATPVVSLQETPEPARDPGAATAEQEVGAPRIVTDLPVSGSIARTGEAEARVISRGLEGNVLSRPIRPALEAPNKAMLGIAAAVTLAIGAVVWTVLPGEDVAPDGTPAQVAATAPAQAALSDATVTTTLSEDPQVGPTIDVASTPGALAAISADDDRMSTILTPADAETVALQTIIALPPEAERDAADVTWTDAPLPSVLDYASVLAPFTADVDMIYPARLTDAPATLELASLAPLAATSGIAPDLASGGVLVPPLPKRPGSLADVGQFVPSAPPVLTDGDTAPLIELAAIEPGAGLSEVVALPNDVPVDPRPNVVTDTPDGPDTPAVANAEPASITPALPTPTALAQSVPEERPVPRPERAGTDLAATAEDPEVEVSSDLPRPTALAAALPDTRPPARVLPDPVPDLAADVTSEVPDTLTAEAPDTGEAVLAALESNPLAGFRPPARPGSAQDAARAALPETTASELAVATSIEPRRRPVGLAAAAQAARIRQDAQALAAVRSAPAPDTSAAITAALTPQPKPEDLPRAEPRNSASMAFPTDVSVARQATIEDAIRLNRINLIGVYGVPSDRRALIRLPSGRYVKVKVGDRVDGGNVAAITDSRLRYTKGGRTVTLEIPSG